MQLYRTPRIRRVCVLTQSVRWEPAWERTKAVTMTWGFRSFAICSGTAAIIVFVFPSLNSQSLLKRSTALGIDADGSISTWTSYGQTLAKT